MLTITFILRLLSRYVAQYCEAHPEAVAAVETELELSKEMAGLLPLKINRIKARMAANNWRTPLFADWLAGWLVVSDGWMIIMKLRGFLTICAEKRFEASGLQTQQHSDIWWFVELTAAIWDELKLERLSDFHKFNLMCAMKVRQFCGSLLNLSYLCSNVLHSL